MVISPASLKTTTKIPDLNTLKSNIASKPVATKEEKAVKLEQAEKTINEPFTQEQLNTVWTQFADRKRSDGFTAEYTILNQQVSVDENYTIRIKLANPLQEDILERFKAELMVYLRKTLNNNNVKLSYTFVQETEKRMIYTPQEKFNYLAEKQPLLRELQKRLMLDTDF